MIDIELKEQIKDDYINGKLSLQEVCNKYGLKYKNQAKKIIGKENMRSFSESGKLAHKKYPNNFKHSEATKQIIREKRLKFMKEHPEKTAWRMGNFSYIEKLFQKLLEDNGIDKKYLIEREHSVFPYFIDFAFVDIKLAVELDGSQHLLKERKESDEKKDNLLLENGWRILRITESEIKHNSNEVLSKLLEMIGNNDIRYEKVGILKAPKTRPKVERNEDGLSVKQIQSFYNQRKVKDRPSKEELFELVKKNSFIAVGKMYGVADATIRKWCRLYKLPCKRKYIPLEK